MFFTPHSIARGPRPMPMVVQLINAVLLCFIETERAYFGLFDGNIGLNPKCEIAKQSTHKSALNAVEGQQLLMFVECPVVWKWKIIIS